MSFIKYFPDDFEYGVKHDKDIQFEVKYIKKRAEDIRKKKKKSKINSIEQ